MSRCSAVSSCCYCCLEFVRRLRRRGLLLHQALSSRRFALGLVPMCAVCVFVYVCAANQKFPVRSECSPACSLWVCVSKRCWITRVAQQWLQMYAKFRALARGKCHSWETRKKLFGLTQHDTDGRRPALSLRQAAC